MVLPCTSCFIFLNFWGIFWAIYEFSWFYSIYFWFLVETCSYESLEGFHASFEIFRFLHEQWSHIEVGMVNIGKILDRLKFGSADGPRVRGRRSPVYEVCHPKLRSAEKGKRGQSAYGPRTVRPVHRLPSNTPVMCSLSKEWTVRQGSADGPPLLRKNLPEAVSVES